MENVNFQELFKLEGAHPWNPCKVNILCYFIDSELFH